MLHPFEADIILLETLDPAIRKNILETGIEIQGGLGLTADMVLLEALF